MKSINTNATNWELVAADNLSVQAPFEILGFDLNIPEHRAFWNKVKTTGKFHASFEPPHRKAAFIPATPVFGAIKK
jgi:hypothetical protein